MMIVFRLGTREYFSGLFENLTDRKNLQGVPLSYLTLTIHHQSLLFIHSYYSIKITHLNIVTRARAYTIFEIKVQEI